MRDFARSKSKFWYFKFARELFASHSQQGVRKDNWDKDVCINANGTDTSKGILRAVLGCMKAFSTSLPVASAQRSWMLNNLEPNFFASGFLNFLEKKRREGQGEKKILSRI